MVNGGNIQSGSCHVYFRLGGRAAGKLEDISCVLVDRLVHSFSNFVRDEAWLMTEPCWNKSHPECDCEIDEWRMWCGKQLKCWIRVFFFTMTNIAMIKRVLFKAIPVPFSSGRRRCSARGSAGELKAAATESARPSPLARDASLYVHVSCVCMCVV